MADSKRALSVFFLLRYSLQSSLGSELIVGVELPVWSNSTSLAIIRYGSIYFWIQRWLRSDTYTGVEFDTRHLGLAVFVWQPVLSANKNNSCMGFFFFFFGVCFVFFFLAYTSLQWSFLPRSQLKYGVSSVWAIRHCFKRGVWGGRENSELLAAQGLGV